ncbi:MAG: hypothetical protein H6672_14650 [Anaerolineaceae bacterium]|nr:hypothetical protein [Anaerolineaceae bacterium]
MNIINEQQKLLGVFQISERDLEVNRRGEVTDRQRAILRSHYEWLTSPRDYLILAGAWFLIACLTCSLPVRLFTNPPNMLLYGFLIIVPIWLLIRELFSWYRVGFARKAWAYTGVLRYTEVTKEERFAGIGKLVRVKTVPAIQVGGNIFYISSHNMQRIFTEGRKYRIYFIEKRSIIIGAEPVE